MALSLKLSGILWWNFANTLVLTRCSSWVCQMTFGIGWGFTEVQILKKVEINSKTVWNILIKFYRHLMLKRSSPRNCKMTFPIGWSFAECQILKKWKWPYLLNCVEYFDKLLRKHWYWHDLAQEIANWHFFYRSRLWRAPKSENCPISWTEWNIVMKFCIHTDIDKM